MPRPKRWRRICGYPDFWSFVPEDSSYSETILLTLDEYETIRLIDHLKMTQEDCAAQMNVSRATVAGIYENARFKLADALIRGKRLRVAGGSYEMAPIPEAENIRRKGEYIMRIAVTYEQEMIGQHFGRTEQFKLYDIADGEIKDTQVISTGGTGHGALAAFLRGAQADTLICGGIGMGARMALEEAGIKLIPGASGNADEAVKSYLAGTLSYNPDEACDHHGHGEGHECHGHGHGHGEGHECHGHGHGHGQEEGHGCHGHGEGKEHGKGHGEGHCCHGKGQEE